MLSALARSVAFALPYLSLAHQQDSLHSLYSLQMYLLVGSL